MAETQAGGGKLQPMAWDDLRSVPLAPVERARRLSKRERAAIARTMAADAARVAVATNSADRDELLLRLTTDLRRRDWHWPLTLAVTGAGTRPSVLVAFAVAVVGLLLIVPWMSALLIGTAIVLAIGHAIQTIAQRKRSPCAIRRAFLEEQCVDCGYDLKGAANAIDPGFLDGMDIGPPVCPECGGSWPRLPPQVPQREVARVDDEDMRSAIAAESTGSS